MVDSPEPAEIQVTPAESKKPPKIRDLTRIGKYVGVKAGVLFLTVVIGIYLTILIANMGGYVDQIRRASIREAIGTMVTGDPELRRLPVAERNAVIEELVRVEEDRLGLNRPFIIRSFTFLKDALLLNFGRAELITSDSGSRQVRLIILERIPSTLVLFATANLLIFFLALFVALFLSRRYGSLLDKLIIGLAPTSAAPGWFYGIFLILIFAAQLRILPFGGMVKAPPPDTSIEYALSLMRHMILPTLSILLSSVFLNIYGWRTFFLIFSAEDYVELARAKGLPSQLIQNRYILRPTLPNIITSFAFVLISLWFGAIILETVFEWPGIGRLFFSAIGLFDTPVIVGLSVIYAYLLALTVFLLDFIYALVDPRVKIGGSGGI